MSPRRKVRIGDVFEVRYDGLYAYMQYMGKPKWLNFDAFRLLRGGFTEPVDIATLSSAATRYFFTSIASILLEDQRCSIVGNFSTEGIAIFPFRQLSLNGWVGVGQTGHAFLGRLEDKPKLALLPIVELVPIDSIIDRLKSDWKPSDSIETLSDLMRKWRRPTLVTVFVEFASATERSSAKAALELANLRVVEPAASSEFKPELQIHAQISKSGDVMRQIDETEALITKIIKPYAGNITGHEMSAE